MSLISGPSGLRQKHAAVADVGTAKPDAGHALALGEDPAKLGTAALEKFRLPSYGFCLPGLQSVFRPRRHWSRCSCRLAIWASKNAETLRRAKEALDEVGLSHRSHMRPAQLSGGEKRSVWPSRAMAKQPRLLFADKPTSALDAESGQRVVICCTVQRARTAPRCSASAMIRAWYATPIVCWAWKTAPFRSDWRQNSPIKE